MNPNRQVGSLPTRSASLCRGMVAGLLISVFPITQAFALDLVNQSTRGLVGTGNDRMVVGFVAEGDDTEEYVLFGVGPELAESGVSGVIPDPKITLFDAGGAVIDANDNWKDHPSASHTNEVLQAAGISLADVEAAMVLTLRAGSYTLVVEDAGGSSGVALGGVAETSVSAPPPPPDTDLDNVCVQELCATNSTLAAACQDFLDTCLPSADHPEEEEQCIVGAYLHCTEFEPFF